MEVHITLYGEDAEQFRAIKEQIEARRDGNAPSNAETCRRLMENCRF